MSWDVRRAVPIYRKFLLENKILLFFTCLLVFLGSVTLIAVYWATQGAVSEAVPEGAADRAAARAALIAVLLMVMPGALLIGIVRIVIRRAVSPLKELTRVADEISAGNLDPGFDFGVHVNCWEIKDCRRTDCEAYQNFSQQCWYIDGTPCEGYESRFPQKLEGCRTCEVYQAHRGDEVVQLADSFRHMTNSLKASQQQLVGADDFQKRLIQNSFNGIIAADAEGVVSIFNQVAEELVGLPREEAVGRMRWHEFLDAELEKAMDIPISHEPVRRVRGFAPREATIRRVDGGRVHVRLAGISLYERGIHIGKVFFFEDMREVKQLREDLIQSERLAAAGQAAAGISHSIKNIMDGFNGGVYVYRVGRKRGDETKMAAGFGMIERNVKIISDLANDLLNFAKERRPQFAPHDPRKLVEDVIAAAGPRRDSRISVKIVQRGPVPEVVVDRHALHQCLVNLLGNAVGAFAEGEAGHISIEYGCEGDDVFFAVRDDGMGMSPRTIAKIRGGMYSTKGSKGTGLGLQVVQKIVKEHGGTLSIASQEGRGSTFRIEIPAGAEVEPA